MGTVGPRTQLHVPHPLHLPLPEVAQLTPAVGQPSGVGQSLPTGSQRLTDKGGIRIGTVLKEELGPSSSPGGMR